MERTVIRPPVSELQFRVYDRQLHPEWFDLLATRRLSRDGIRIEVHFTPAGHVLSWCSGKNHLVEVICRRDHSLPESGRRISHKFQGEQRARCQLTDTVNYQVSLQSERLTPEQFLHEHDELASLGGRQGLLIHFRPQHRLGLSPLGLIIVEAVSRGFSVATFHTFPQEFALIKTQSLIEIA